MGFFSEFCGQKGGITASQNAAPPGCWLSAVEPLHQQYHFLACRTHLYMKQELCLSYFSSRTNFETPDSHPELQPLCLDLVFEDSQRFEFLE